MFTLQRLLSCAIGSVLGCAFASPVSADVIEWSAVLQIDESSVAELPVGDRFPISLSFDDSAVDTSPTTWGGRFPDALLSFSISRDPTNSGTWDPASGTPDLAQDNFVTNANSEQLTIEVGGVGFPSAGPGDFRRVEVTIVFSVDIVDAGSGQTLREIFGEPIDIESAISSVGGVAFGETYTRASGTVDNDHDGDGVRDFQDACDFTPPGGNIVTDPDDPLYGTLRHDADGDCDCDLADFAMFQIELTGPNPQE